MVAWVSISLSHPSHTCALTHSSPYLFLLTRSEFADNSSAQHGFDPIRNAVVVILSVFQPCWGFKGWLHQQCWEWLLTISSRSSGKWWVVHTAVLSDSCFNHCSLSIGLLFQTEFKGQHFDCCCFSLMIPLLCSGYGWLVVALLAAHNVPILPDASKNLPEIPPEVEQKRQALINLARICFNWFSFCIALGLSYDGVCSVVYLFSSTFGRCI